MIWDCMIFNGELDVLEIRLRYLSSISNLRFAICESNKTFQGGDKPYYLEAAWDRFKEFHNRIEYIQIEQDPSDFVFRKVKSYDPNNGPFLMEAQCRLGLSHINDKVQDGDTVILSDVDEIWDKGIIGSRWTVPVALQMNFYGYYLNNQNIQGADIKWNGSVMCIGHHWKTSTPQQIRDMRNVTKHVPNAGWHFSWMGDIKKKIESFAHVEFNRPDITNEESIKRAVERGEDVLQRPGVKYAPVPMESFPADLRSILLDYPHLILNI